MALIRPTGRPLAQRAREIEQASREHFEPEELAALWTALRRQPFWFGYFRLQYHFGCRCSEVAIVMKEDVSLKTKQIVIRRIKKTDVEEGFHEYTYEMSNPLVEALKGVVPCVAKENPWFFGSSYRSHMKHKETDSNTGLRMATIRITDGGWRAVSRGSAQSAFKAACEDAKVTLRLRQNTHVLRHTRATLLFARGATVADVQYLLGHNDPKTTQKYIGWAESLKRRASLTALLGDEK